MSRNLGLLTFMSGMNSVISTFTENCSDISLCAYMPTGRDPHHTFFTRQISSTDAGLYAYSYTRCCRRSYAFLRKRTYALRTVGLPSRQMHRIDFSISLFTARCTTVQSAVLLSLVVCLSLCPSVTLVDHDHIGGKSWKLIARTIISPTSSFFVAKISSTYSQGNMEKFWGD